MRLLVADQNMFNPKPGGVRDRLAAESDLQVVVPDVALVEMCKGETWALTMELGLGELRGFESRVVLSASVYDALNHELATGAATTRDGMLPTEVQPALQMLLQSVVGATWTQGDAVHAKAAEVQAEIKAELLDEERTRESTAALVRTWHDGLARAIMSALASTKVDGEFLAAFIVAEAYSLCLQIARDRMKLSEEQTLEFIRAKPMVLRYLLAVARHTLRLARNGKDSVAQTAASKELNNRLDIEYVLVATYVDGFMSKDRRAVEAYEDLRAMLDMQLVEARRIRDSQMQEMGKSAAPAR
jgi:hypothetical protein